MLSFQYITFEEFKVNFIEFKEFTDEGCYLLEAENGFKALAIIYLNSQGWSERDNWEAQILLDLAGKIVSKIEIESLISKQTER